jgi:endoglucanase
MKPLLLACFLSLVSTAQAQPETVDAFTQCRKLGRGVNILGYDRIWRSPDQARFKAEYFAKLKEAGFDTVRINLHPFRHMDREKNWELSPSWWATLDWALTHAQAAGLMVILDMHEFNAIGRDPASSKPQFLAFWRQLSERLEGADSDVIFEILNEPSQALTPEMWNAWMQEVLEIIREKHPLRTVIIGPASYNSIDKLPKLQLPEDDRNIIVTVHYYQPFEFTHQGAPWVNRQDQVGIEWLGTEQDRAAIASDFDRADAWAQEQKRPLFLGEFGAYDKAAMDSRTRYLQAITRAAEERDWAWAYWQFDSDFLLYDVDQDQWVQPVLNALIPREGS